MSGLDSHVNIALDLARCLHIPRRCVARDPSGRLSAANLNPTVLRLGVYAAGIGMAYRVGMDMSAETLNCNMGKRVDVDHFQVVTARRHTREVNGKAQG